MKQILNLLPEGRPVCFVVKKAFPAEFCTTMIAAQESRFNSANTHYPVSYRNNERMVLDDVLLSDTLFAEIKNYLPSRITPAGRDGEWQVKKLNGRIRVCRYLPGQYFNKHLDGVHYESAIVQSMLTFMVYLNGKDAFEGGRTLFFNSKADDTIVASFLPDAGDLIIFDHQIWHSGETVLSGEKYILRSDILYERIDKKSIQEEHISIENGHLGYIWSIIKFGNDIVTAGRDKTIKVWNTEGNLKTSMAGHENSVLSLLQLNRNILVSGSRDQTVSVWKRRRGLFTPERQVRLHEATVLTLCKLTNALFASGGGDGRINLVDAKGNLRASWAAHQAWIWKIVALDKYKIASAGEDGSVRIWDWKNQKLLLDWTFGKSPVTAMVFDRQHSRLIIGRHNGTIQVLYWDSIGCALRPIREIEGHSEIVRCLVIEKGILYSGGEDNKVCTWNLNNGQQMTTYLHNDFVQDILIDGGNVYSVSYDGNVIKKVNPAASSPVAAIQNLAGQPPH